MREHIKEDIRKKEHMGKVLFAAAAALFALSGCAASRTQDAAAEQRDEGRADHLTDEKEPYVLDWYINYSWFTSKWGGNVVSETITERTGTSVNFIAPKGKEMEKLNTLIASDQLPDLITLSWEDAAVSEMIEKGMVYPLNVLADRYAPQFWEAADELVCSWYTSSDGNLYQYPNTTYVPQDYEEHDDIGANQTFLVRKDIYEAIGSPDMTTPEGFMQAVREAYRQFPETDGEELIPIGAHPFTDKGCDSFDSYLQNFLAVPYEKEGQYYDRYTDPEYLAWLKVFRQLRQEGYLKDAVFIDQRMQMEEKIAAGRYFCMIYQRTDMVNQQKQLYGRDPDSIYIAVDGPRNSKGEDPVLPGAGINGWTVTLISKNCERPDLAIQLCAWLMSEEGQKTVYLGVEGVTYDMVEDRPVVRPEVLELLNSDREAYDRIYGADDTYWMLQDIVLQSGWRQEQPWYLAQLEEWTYPYTHYMGQYEIRTAPGSREAYAEQRIRLLWGETLPRLLLAEDEETFDRILAEFAERREEAGYGAYLEECTRQMTENKKKLGIE